MGINRKRLINVLGSRLREKFQEENVMKVRQYLVVLAATVLIAGLAVRPSFAAPTATCGAATGTCGPQNLSGVYQCTGSGFILPVLIPPFETPYTMQGNLFADGFGDFTLTDGNFEWTFNVLGIPVNQVVFAQGLGNGYVIGPNGDGTAELNWASTIFALTGIPGPIFFQNYSLGINTVNTAGQAQQFTLTTDVFAGSPPNIEFFNTGVLICNHQ